MNVFLLTDLEGIAGVDDIEYMDRSGEKYARALLVTSGMATRSRSNMRMRAAKLGIELIEWDNAGLDQLINCLRRE